MFSILITEVSSQGYDQFYALWKCLEIFNIVINNVAMEYVINNYDCNIEVGNILALQVTHFQKVLKQKEQKLRLDRKIIHRIESIKIIKRREQREKDKIQDYHKKPRINAEKDYELINITSQPSTLRSTKAAGFGIIPRKETTHVVRI